MQIQQHSRCKSEESLDLGEQALLLVLLLVWALTFASDLPCYLVFKAWEIFKEGFTIAPPASPSQVAMLEKEGIQVSWDLVQQPNHKKHMAQSKADFQIQ